MITCVQALELAELMWPEFITEGPAVFLRTSRRGALQPISTFPDLVAAEAFVNHVHLLDALEHDATLPEEPFWNPRHPDFKSGLRLASSVAECWAAKLAQEFPKRQFAVFATRDDNPVVRFHSVVPDLPLWLEPSEFPHGSVLCIIVASGRIERRLGSLMPEKDDSEG